MPVPSSATRVLSVRRSTTWTSSGSNRSPSSFASRVGTRSGRASTSRATRYSCSNMRSVVGTLLPRSWFRIHCRTPEYSASVTNSDKVSDANCPSENTATNSRSSEVATVLMAASSENSRMKFCDRPRNGTSSSSEPRKTYQTSEPTSATLCGRPGSRSAVARAAVSSVQVAAATIPKRRSMIANGCGSIRYDQLSRPIAARPRPITAACVHHQALPSAPVAMPPTRPSTAAQPASAIHPEPGRRRGCRQAALTIAAAVSRSNAARAGMSQRATGPGRPKSNTLSTAMNSRLPDWHSVIAAYTRLRGDGWASTTISATRYRPSANSASSQNRIGRPGRPRGPGRTSAVVPSSKYSRTSAWSSTLANCACNVCWRTRSASSMTQRGERANASASLRSAAASPPTTPRSARPTCGRSAGSSLAASSTRPCGSMRQRASMCGVIVSARISTNRPKQPSNAPATSKRSRQPIQRAARCAWPVPASPRPESKSDSPSWLEDPVQLGGVRLGQVLFRPGARAGSAASCATAVSRARPTRALACWPALPPRRGSTR